MRLIILKIHILSAIMFTITSNAQVVNDLHNCILGEPSNDSKIFRMHIYCKKLQ
jgi:hypothetical protein